MGDTFQVVTDTAKAKQIVMYRESKARDVAMSKSGRITLEKLNEMAKEGEIKELNVIVKTDVGGTAEVLSDMMQKLSNDKVRIRVIRSRASAPSTKATCCSRPRRTRSSSASTCGRNATPQRGGAGESRYPAAHDHLRTDRRDEEGHDGHARAGVQRSLPGPRRRFARCSASLRSGNVAGCYVLDGTVRRNSQIRLLRDNVVVHTGKIDTLKRFKDDVSEVKAGFECGITIANYSDMKAGDIIEAFVTERVAPEVIQ